MSRFAHLTEPGPDEASFLDQEPDVKRPLAHASGNEIPVFRPSPTLAMPRAVRPASAAAAASVIRPGGASQFRGQSAFNASVKLNDEQQAIVECPDRLVVANAFAGSGKTTTAAAYAARRPGSRILYMPFGKSVQLEAVRRFPPNTTCQTINSIAFGAMRNLQPKLAKSWTAFTVKQDMGLFTYRQAGLVQSILHQFMVSADPDIRPSHAEEAFEKWRATEAEIADAIAVGRLAWRRMRDPADPMKIPFDAQLKAWSLGKPKLDYDTIIFDEAQDTNPVTAYIIEQQRHATKLYIGDRHQSIYQFRGAFNAMESIGDDPRAKMFYLSQTWRFGQEIADVANLILQEFKGEKVPIVGMGGADHGGPKTQALLARTNAQLFREAAPLRGKGVHWVGANGIADYGVDRMLQAYDMYRGVRDTVTDPVLRGFQSWGELQRYAEDARDQEIKVLANVIEEFRHDTPGLVHDLKMNEERDASLASLVLTTAHRAKGLEWSHVRLCDDFEILGETEEKLQEDPQAEVNDAEVNLVYVAATRAIHTLELDADSRAWMESIDANRAKRQQSLQKQFSRASAARSFLRRERA